MLISGIVFCCLFVVFYIVLGIQVITKKDLEKVLTIIALTLGLSFLSAVFEILIRMVN